MSIFKHQNHVVIGTLESLGHKVRIRHVRKYVPSIVEKLGGHQIEYSIARTGGSTEVTIEADGQTFKGVSHNPKSQSYNKNFGVHVALQRAIKVMNEINERGVEEEAQGD